MAVRTLALTYLTVMLIIPLAVIFYDGLRGGLGGMVRAILQPVALHALLLSLWTAGVMAVINAVMGTLTAYVLVRYSFPASALLNAADRSALRHPDAGDRRDAGGAVRPAARARRVARSKPGAENHLRAAGDHPGAAVHHISVRDARGAAGAAKSRPRSGGGGGDHRRGQLDDLPARGAAGDRAAADGRHAAELRARDRRVRRDRGRGRQYPAALADRRRVCAGRDRIREPARRQRDVDRDAGDRVWPGGAGGFARRAKRDDA